MTTPNRIVLKSCLNIVDEAPAQAALKPGHLLEMLSDGDVQKHSVYGGNHQHLIAVEDALQGNDVTEEYAAADLVQYHRGMPHDRVYARVPAAAPSIAIGDVLISNGDGTVIKAPITSLDNTYSAVAASAAVTNTTTETAFDKSYTFAANSLKVGDVIRIRVQCIATSTNSTDTLNIKLKIGSTVIAATGAVDVANNDIGYIEADVVIRTIGAAGTLVGTGLTNLGVPGTATTRAANLASTAVDTTATQAITVTATWSVASASNSVRLDVLSIHVLRAGGQHPVGIADEAVDNSAGVSESFVRTRLLAA